MYENVTLEKMADFLDENGFRRFSYVKYSQKENGGFVQRKENSMYLIQSLVEVDLFNSNLVISLDKFIYLIIQINKDENYCSIYKTLMLALHGLVDQLKVPNSIDKLLHVT